jgi:GTP-binding protein LepA
MEIIQERLEREYNLDLITTAPSVVYQVYMKDGSMKTSRTPRSCPRRQHRPGRGAHLPAHHPRSPRIRRRGPALCQERRGEQKSIQYASSDRVIITYDMPLSEVLFDFHDKLKSARAATPRWTTSSSATAPTTSCASTCS